MRFRFLYLLAIAAVLSIPAIAHASSITFVPGDGTPATTYYFGYTELVGASGGNILFNGQQETSGIKSFGPWQLLDPSTNGGADFINTTTGQTYNGIQLFSGDASSPTYLSGTFGVTGVDGPFLGDAEVIMTLTPEPSSLILLGTGALGMFGAIRRRRFTA